MCGSPPRFHVPCSSTPTIERASVWVKGINMPVPLILSAFRSPCLHIKHQTSDIKHPPRQRFFLLPSTFFPPLRFPVSSFLILTSSLSSRFSSKEFRIALRANNACHYAEALERVRGKAPGRQITSYALVRDYATRPVSKFRATARDLSSRRPGWKIHRI
jgi:hypothetical protein